MEKTLKAFNPGNPTISKGIAVDGQAWVATCSQAQTFPLFEVPDPGVEDCTVLYRARLKTAGLTGRTYLEMWCRFPGRGEFFSKGLNHTVTGSTDWASYETPFYLKKGEKPDLIRLDLVVEATRQFLWKKPVTGKVWIKEVALVSGDRA